MIAFATAIFYAEIALALVISAVLVSSLIVGLLWVFDVILDRLS